MNLLNRVIALSTLLFVFGCSSEKEDSAKQVEKKQTQKDHLFQTQADALQNAKDMKKDIEEQQKKQQEALKKIKKKD